MPIRKKWPNGAEASRITAKQLAADTEELVQAAIVDIRTNPMRCELHLVYVLQQLAHIQRVLTKAKVGR